MVTIPGAIRDRALRGLDRLPALSPHVGRLLSRLAFRNVDYKEIAALASKDALLCAHLLRAVNAAGLAQSQPITSVRQAVSLLGIRRLRQIALGCILSNIFSHEPTPPSWSRQRFNLHSGATALLTEAILESLPQDNKDGAFVAGMLHDFGKLLIAITVPEEYETIAAMALVREQAVFDCEREMLGTDHAELSALALRKWGVPEPVCQAVRQHHDPEAASQLSIVIAKADCFVNHLGITVLPPALHETEPPSIEIPGAEFDTGGVLQRFESECIEFANFFQ